MSESQILPLGIFPCRQTTSVPKVSPSPSTAPGHHGHQPQQVSILLQYFIVDRQLLPAHVTATGIAKETDLFTLSRELAA